MKSMAKLAPFVLYLLALLLISEWIYPFVYLTKLSGAGWAILFVALSLAMYFLRWRFYVTLPVHLLLLYLLTGIYYHNGNPFDPSWLSSFFTAVKSGFVNLLSFNASNIGMIFVTLIFFVALWLLSYITAYSILRKQRIMSVLVLTVVYLTVVNTFTSYNGGFALIRTIILGFVILHFALSMRLETSNRLSGLTSKWRPAVYHISILALLAIFILASMSMPRQGPYWADPVPAIKSTLGIGTTKTVGYSEDDTRLGGSLEADHSEVFQVQTDRPHYYRVEAKRTYTGVGWANQTNTKQTYFESNSAIPLSLNETYADETADVTFSFAASNDYLVYPYGSQSIQSSNQTFAMRNTTEKITPADTIKNYSIAVAEPIYDTKKMREATYGGVSNQFMAQYTQLPDTLPDRVKDLAKKITKDTTNPYDATKAVENYLSFSGRYTYSTTEATDTLPDADYVDQFLFETKIGYCDNFSTAMIVLLRAEGIPARWAKGFAAGEKIQTAENEKTTYQITNDDAHSWPEVYFPGTGWVPFEPTATFSNPEQFINSNSDATENNQNGSSSSSETPADQSKDSQNSSQTDHQNGSEQTPKEKAEQSAKTHATSNFKLPSWFWLVPFLLGILLIILGVIFQRRLRILSLERKIRQEKITFTKAYLTLIKLSAKVEPRQAQETLRSHAGNLDQKMKTTSFSDLTTSYEAFLYGTQSLTLAEEKDALLQVIQHLKNFKSKNTH
ncbi:transglutaminase-like domain-containing protein [Listeria ilorinensis]|uniref:transglutaminase-like domain-containing protein n=1 Tax=Listeria ilorinensis TaxID=2867439 RepID=UPI001EF3F35B|nr:transglutaminase domain-containing protein [Listeria ilorinensis]